MKVITKYKQSSYMNSSMGYIISMMLVGISFFLRNYYILGLSIIILIYSYVKTIKATKFRKQFKIVRDRGIECTGKILDIKVDYHNDGNESFVSERLRIEYHSMLLEKDVVLYVNDLIPEYLFKKGDKCIIHEIQSGELIKDHSMMIDKKHYKGNTLKTDEGIKNIYAVVTEIETEVPKVKKEEQNIIS